MEINREVAAKVLEVVDAGLVRGLGNPFPGEMCVEAAVCFALGLPHGDDPSCVSRALRAYKIALNDCVWSSRPARAKGLRRLAIAQLGSDKIDELSLVQALAREAKEYSVPSAVAAGSAAWAARAAEAAEAAGATARAAAWAAEAAGAAAEAAGAAARAARAAARAAQAAGAAGAAAYDKVLADHAERVVQILIRMNAPGCAFLDLAPLEE